MRRLEATLVLLAEFLIIFTIATDGVTARSTPFIVGLIFSMLGSMVSMHSLEKHGTGSLNAFYLNTIGVLVMIVGVAVRLA